MGSEDTQEELGVNRVITLKFSKYKLLLKIMNVILIYKLPSVLKVYVAIKMVISPRSHSLMTPKAPALQSIKSRKKC